MESDALYLDGDDPAKVERVTNDTIEVVRGHSGEVDNGSFAVGHPAERIGEEVDLDPGSAEDRVER